MTKPKLWQNSKIEIVTQIKTQLVTKMFRNYCKKKHTLIFLNFELKNHDKKQKWKLLQYLKTHIETKLNLKCSNSKSQNVREKKATKLKNWNSKLKKNNCYIFIKLKSLFWIQKLQKAEILTEYLYDLVF